MKRCQKCSRTFPDENQKFCTFDGGLLLAEQPPPPAFDPNLTVRATSKELTMPTRGTEASEAPTSINLPDLSETITSFGSATFQESATGSTGKTTSSDLKLPPSLAPTSVDLVAPAGAIQSAPPPHVPQAPIQSAPLVAAQPTSQRLPPVSEAPKKRSVLPWILGILVVLLLLGSGAAAAGYFLWLKPFLEARNVKPEVTNTRPTPDENANRPATINNSTPAPSPSVETKEEPVAFVPPPNSEKFTNSKDDLDGKLADHFIDFSFYYPDAWVKDPKASAAGTNFTKVERLLKDKSGDYMEERAVVSWYESNGGFDSDLSILPTKAQEFSAQISKDLSGYEKVSEGETKVNSMKAYEFRFRGVFKNTGKGDLPYWGRVIFLPPGNADEKNGVKIVMLATSLAPGVSSADDVGVKGELPIILDSFRFGTKP